MSELKACSNPYVKDYIDELIREARLKGYKVTKKNLSVTSEDPFWGGTPSDHKKAQWLLDEIKKSSLADSNKLYLRRIHYILVSTNPPVIKLNGEPYQNTLKDWNWLNDIAKIARYLEYLDFEDFIDGRRPELKIIEQGKFIIPNPVIPELETHFVTLDNRFDLDINSDGFDNFSNQLKCISEDIELRNLIESRADLPEIYLSSDTQDLIPSLRDINRFNYSKYSDYSHFYMEIWVEKNTLNDVLTEISNNFNISVIVGTGEFSITQVALLMQRVKENAKGRPIRIFVLSDFDPAGQSIPLTIARKIEYFKYRFGYNFNLKLTKLALTYEQVVKYSLPKTVIKDTDLRKEDFEARFGVGATEIDALVARSDGKELLTNIILETIEPYRKYDELVRKHYSLKDSYSNRSQIVDELNREILQPLLTDYESRYEDITNQIKELEANYQSEADNLAVGFRSAVNSQISSKETEFNELYLTLKETIRKISDLKTDLEDTCNEIYLEYRTHTEELNNNLQNDLSILEDELNSLNDEFTSNSDLSLNPITLQSPQKFDESHLDCIYSSELSALDQLKKYKQWQGVTLDI